MVKSGSPARTGFPTESAKSSSMYPETLLCMCVTRVSSTLTFPAIRSSLVRVSISAATERMPISCCFSGGTKIALSCAGAGEVAVLAGADGEGASTFWLVVVARIGCRRISAKYANATTARASSPIRDIFRIRSRLIGWPPEREPVPCPQ